MIESPTCAVPVSPSRRRFATPDFSAGPGPGPWRWLAALPWAVAVWACQGGSASGAPNDPMVVVDAGPATAAADAGEPAPPPCVFDADCGDPGLVCLGGACTADPRDGRFCGGLVACPAPLLCDDGGLCVCRTDADCGPGSTCDEAGRCLGPPFEACVSDGDCATPDAPVALCLGGRCVARGVTEEEVCPDPAASPGLAGPHRLVVGLPIRPALPKPVRALLGTVAAPFRVLAGDGLTLELGLPPWMDRLVSQLIVAWAANHLEPWHRAVLGAFGDLDAVLATWRIEEHLSFEAADPPFRGTATGDRRELLVAFEHGQAEVVGRPEEIFGRALTLAPPVVEAGCGHLAVRSRALPLPLGALVVWVADQLVEEATEGRFDSVDAALGELEGRFCSALAQDVGDSVGLGVGPVLEDACTAELDRLRQAQTEALREADLGVDPWRWSGDGLVDPTTGEVVDGRWDGRLVGTALDGPLELYPED